MSHHSAACDTPVKRAVLVNCWEGVTLPPLAGAVPRARRPPRPPAGAGLAKAKQKKPHLACRLRYYWSKVSITRSGSTISTPRTGVGPAPGAAMSDAGIEIGEPPTPAHRPSLATSITS